MHLFVTRVEQLTKTFTKYGVHVLKENGSYIFQAQPVDKNMVQFVLARAWVNCAFGWPRLSESTFREVYQLLTNDEDVPRDKTIEDALEFVVDMLRTPVDCDHLIHALAEYLPGRHSNDQQEMHTFVMLSREFGMEKPVVTADQCIAPPMKPVCYTMISPIAFEAFQ